VQKRKNDHSFAHLMSAESSVWGKCFKHLNGSITSLFNIFVHQNLKISFQNTNKLEEPQAADMTTILFNMMVTYQHDR
jgi:hypothetical protein